MKQDNLFDLMQNAVVASLALHGFTLGYYNIVKYREGECPFPPINYMFYVLPIVYNHDAMETFRSSNELYTVIIKNKAIMLELQERANKLTSKTFEGLNLSFNKKVLTFNPDTKTVGLGKGFTTKRLTLPLSMSSTENSVKKIQDCAVKLGAIFAKRSPKNIEFELNIKI